MGESVKALLAFFFIIASVAAVVTWWSPQADATAWGARICTTAVAAVFLALLLMLQFRRDVVPDYLKGGGPGEYFNRGGFCFSLGVDSVNGVCQFHFGFQNQYERPCIGRIALRPARGFFLTRAKIETIALEIPCEAAAFGVASIPIPLPPEVLGKKQEFEGGASVEYPEGRGQRLRFRDGMLIRANTNFGNSFGTAVTILGALSGTLVLSTPAKVTVQLPFDAAVETPPGAAPRIQTIWKLGDPPLVVEQPAM